MRFVELYIPHSLKYNPYLDGLRGVSITLVILFHFFPDFFSFGFVGVDIFFFLSGFLITSIIITKLEKNELSFKEFYRNRARRLFPALIFALVFCLIVGYLFLFPEEYKDLAKHIKSTAFYYENFRLIGEIGYWDKEALAKPLLHMWSLSVEEQFYIFWPLLVFLIFKLSGSYKKRLFVFLVLFFTFFLVSIYMSFKYPDKSFYHTLARGWELSFGSLLSLIIFYRKEFIKEKLLSQFHLLNGVSIFLIFSAPILFFNVQQYSPIRLLVLLSIVFLVILKVNFYKDKLLGNKFLIFLGLISYSLYIWHYIILSFFHIFGYESFYFKVIAFALVFIISVFSFYFIELPFRKSNKYSVAITLTATLIFIGGIGHYIASKDGLLDRPIVKQNESIDFSREEPKDEKCVNIAKTILGKEPLFNYCRSTSRNREDIKIVILGDSHGFILYEGLHRVIENKKIGLMVLANSGCPPYVNTFMGRNLREVKSCEKKIYQIYKVLNNLPNVELVIFTTRLAIYATEKGFGEVEKRYTQRPHRFKEYFSKSERNTYNPYVLFLQGVKRTFDYFAKKNTPLIFVLDNPELGFSPKKCLKRLFLPLPSNCKLDYKVYWNRQGKIKEDIKELAKKYKNVYLFDLANVLCDGQYCYVYMNGQTLYTDDDHLSKYGSYIVSKQLYKLINNILEKQK